LTRPVSETSTTSSLLDDDDAQRAVEDDKRRRNTAASARFRVKKKQREQALEHRTKELEDQLDVVRLRMQELETENKWLKSLVLEKNAAKSDASLQRPRTEVAKADSNRPEAEP